MVKTHFPLFKNRGYIGRLLAGRIKFEASAEHQPTKSAKPSLEGGGGIGVIDRLDRSCNSLHFEVTSYSDRKMTTPEKTGLTYGVFEKRCSFKIRYLTEKTYPPKKQVSPMEFLKKCVSFKHALLASEASEFEKTLRK